MSPEEAKFEKEMAEIYHRVRQKTGYRAERFRKMAQDEGGVKTARRLLSVDAASDGFGALIEMDATDLNMEALVLRPEFQPLFTESMLARARERLGLEPS